MNKSRMEKIRAELKQESSQKEKSPDVIGVPSSDTKEFLLSLFNDNDSITQKEKNIQVLKANGV